MRILALLYYSGSLPFIQPYSLTFVALPLHLLGFEVAESTVAKYRIKSLQPSSQTWKTFLSNHAGEIVGLDFFVIPTATFRNLYCFLILLHDRRRIIHSNVSIRCACTTIGTGALKAHGYSYRRAGRHHCADYRRAGDRQGDRRPRDSSIEWASESAVCRGQLRGLPRITARIRTIRLCQRGLHRGGLKPQRTIRGGERRHNLSRRDRRNAPCGAGTAASRTSRAQNTPRRRARRARIGCARDRRD